MIIDEGKESPSFQSSISQLNFFTFEVSGMVLQRIFFQLDMTLEMTVLNFNLKLDGRLQRQVETKLSSAES